MKHETKVNHCYDGRLSKENSVEIAWSGSHTAWKEAQRMTSLILPQPTKLQNTSSVRRFLRSNSDMEHPIFHHNIPLANQGRLLEKPVSRWSGSLRPFQQCFHYISNPGAENNVKEDWIAKAKKAQLWPCLKWDKTGLCQQPISLVATPHPPSWQGLHHNSQSHVRYHCTCWCHKG